MPDQRTSHAKTVWPGATLVRKQRLALNLTLPEIAARSGLSESTVLRTEVTGRGTDSTWRALASALGVPRWWIDPEHAQELRDALADPHFTECGS